MRKAAIRLVRWRWFDRFTLLCIAANCVTLAMGSSRPGFEATALARTLEALEQVFLGVFSAEMLLKWLAMGIVAGRGAYFRDGECDAGRLRLAPERGGAAGGQHARC